MGFFDKFKQMLAGDTPDEAEVKAEQKRKIELVRQAELRRQEIDLVELKRGGIPEMAQQRLRELSEQSLDKRLFTSNLDPDELALLRRTGFRAGGLVAGSSMYHVGNLYASDWSDVEVKELSFAYDEATRLAVGRMQQELELIGAHGVVGVRLNLRRREWAERTIEVELLGTAVDEPDRRPATPWLSDLSVQEWYALHRAGYEPTGLVWGHCAWFILTSQADEWQERSWNNVEMAHWSTALSQARNLAMHKLQGQIKEQKATGVVGVKINRRLDHVRLTTSNVGASERMHHSLLVSVIGTAIKLRSDAPRAIPQTLNIVSLKDGRMRPLVTRQQETLTVQDGFDADDDDSDGE